MNPHTDKPGDIEDIPFRGLIAVLIGTMVVAMAAVWFLPDQEAAFAVLAIVVAGSVAAAQVLAGSLPR